MPLLILEYLSESAYREKVILRLKFHQTRQTAVSRTKWSIRKTTDMKSMLKIKSVKNLQFQHTYERTTKIKQKLIIKFNTIQKIIKNISK